MNQQTGNELSILTTEELRQVAGGIGAIVPKEVRAEDLYGNTMSVEEYMDHQLDVANGHASPHDFYSPGYNPNKPNIWVPKRP